MASLEMQTAHDEPCSTRRGAALSATRPTLKARFLTKSAEQYAASLMPRDNRTQMLEDSSSSFAWTLGSQDASGHRLFRTQHPTMNCQMFESTPARALL